MKKKTVDFYSIEEVGKLQAIAQMRHLVQRKSALKEFCKEYSRPYPGAYYKMNGIKNTLKVANSALAVAVAINSEIRIPFRTIRVEGNEVVFTF